MVDRPAEFVSDDKSAEVVKPADGMFDLPSPAVTPGLAFILLPFADAVLAMRRDEIDVAVGKPIAEGVTVDRLVVDQRAGNERRRGLIEQRLDEVHLAFASRSGVDRQREATGVCEDHEFSPLAAFGLADLFAPF